MLNPIMITAAVLGGINTILAIILVVAERFLVDYGECKITINDEKELTVNGGSSILTTLNGQKIFLPSACGGRGTCAYCKCKVTEGGGVLLPTEEPFLSASEIEESVRLACQVKVKQDLRIVIPEELFLISEFEAEIVLIKNLTHDIKLLRMRLVDPEEIRFVPGQYVQLQSQPYGRVRESVSRAYSIASPNSETRNIDLMIRLVPEGICTTWVHEHLKEGDHIKFTGPMGDFRYHDGKGEILMVAGGSGMAPMIPLLAQLAALKTGRKVTYFFGAVTSSDLFYVDEMRRFEQEFPDFTFIPTLSLPDAEDHWEGETGLVTESLTFYLKGRNTEEAQGYLCGSPGMINACVEVFNDHGLTRERIYYDPFA